MVNKLKMIGVSIMLCLEFSSCGQKVETSSQNSDSVLQYLSQEQKEYLHSQHFTDDAIAMMEYESVNYKLLGTGLELYNPSSGVEKNGVRYSITKDEGSSFVYETKTAGNEQITYEEALNIRLKENRMRVDDFLNYKFEIVLLGDKDEERHYKLMLALKGYTNTYVNVYFSEKLSGEIHMKAPIIYYKETEDSGQTFSFLYDSALRDEFFSDCENPHYQKKMIYGIQYSSITDHSLVLEVYNFTDEEQKLLPSFELFNIDNGRNTLIKQEKSTQVHKVRANTFSIWPVNFAMEEGTLEKGRYLLKYGKNAEGYVYTEQIFEVESW